MKTEEFKQKIDEFMRWKSKEIEKKLTNILGKKSSIGLQYYCSKDAEVIERMKPEDVLAIDEHFRRLLCLFMSDNLRELKDDDHCPFCIVYGCRECPYAETHGTCNNPRSTYGVITNTFGQAITLAIGSRRICRKIAELFGE